MSAEARKTVAPATGRGVPACNFFISMRVLSVFAGVLCLLCCIPAYRAQVAARDIPYAGTIRLNVDATDIARHIFWVRETIPVRGGDSPVLLYPQ